MGKQKRSTSSRQQKTSQESPCWLWPRVFHLIPTAALCSQPTLVHGVTPKETTTDFRQPKRTLFSLYYWLYIKMVNNWSNHIEPITIKDNHALRIGISSDHLNKAAGRETSSDRTKKLPAQLATFPCAVWNNTWWKSGVLTCRVVHKWRTTKKWYFPH